MAKRSARKARVLLSECTLLDVEEQLKRSAKIVVPVGATEQHGPHAPFGTDSILATEVSVRLARRIDALVAPAITYGVSGDHRGYAGVPFVSTGTMTALVQDVVVSLAEGGFREIILVNGHYTNSIVLSAAIMEIGDRLPAGTIAFPFNYWDALPPDELSEYLGADVGLHANIGETSAVLAVDESLVTLDDAVREYPAFPVEPTPAMVSAYFFSARGTLPRASRSGVWGDPGGSSPELGRRYLDQIERAGVRFIENVESLFRAFPDQPA
jgi:creatinine amidohydrolase/Fe(II)-dependent formamide hydrolase-like protein